MAINRIYFIALDSEALPVLKTSICSSRALRDGLFFEGQFINTWEMCRTEKQGLELLKIIRSQLGIDQPRFTDRQGTRLNRQ